VNKKEYQEYRNKEDNTLVNFHPELNQSGIYDSEGDKLPKPKREQYDPIPRGFVDSGIIFRLTASDFKVYFFLSSKCNPYRNTRVTNYFFIRETGFIKVTLDRALRRLEFYHLISRRKYFIRPKRSKRIITLLRWDTAYKKLVKEGKLIVDSSGDTVFTEPYPYK